MFKLVRVLENVQHKGAKGWTNEGEKGFKEESNDIQQYTPKGKITQCKPALMKYVYLKLILRPLVALTQNEIASGT